MSVTVVTQIQRVVVRGSGASYSDARVLAYLRSILTTNGDLLTVAAGTLARVGIGSSGQVLTVSGGAAVWAAPTGFANPMSAQGDLIIGGASGAATRLARGTNGQILSVSGSTLAWIDAPTSYTDADAIAAIAGEVTDHQLIQRQNGTGLQGISLSTIYDGAIDAIEALGNGVLVTAGGVLDNAVGTEGQVLTWTGGTAVFAAASSGGMTNPMTSTWDLIRGGASGTPTRLAIGRRYTLPRVTSDGELAYAPGSTGFGALPGRYSLAIADGNNTPVMHGWTTAVTRVSSSSFGGIRLNRLAGCQMHGVSTSTAANQWAGWQLATSTSASLNAYCSVTGLIRPDPTAASAYAIGLIVGTAGLQGATGPFYNAAPTTFAVYGLRRRMATQTNWHFIMYDGTTFTETDTGVAAPVNSSASATDGANHGLVVGRDARGVWWEIWNELTSPPTLLASGEATSNVPASFANALAAYLGMGTNGASGTIQVNALGFSTLTVGGPF